MNTRNNAEKGRQFSHYERIIVREIHLAKIKTVDYQLASKKKSDEKNTTQSLKHINYAMIKFALR